MMVPFSLTYDFDFYKVMTFVKSHLRPYLS